MLSPTWECHCGTPNCRKTITPQDWRRPELQAIGARGAVRWGDTLTDRDPVPLFLLPRSRPP